MKENLETWLLFTHSASCWNYAGMDGTLIGMDYPAVKVIADSLYIELTPRIMAGLHAIEVEAIRKSREKNSNDKPKPSKKRRH